MAHVFKLLSLAQLCHNAVQSSQAMIMKTCFFLLLGLWLLPVYPQTVPFDSVVRSEMSGTWFNPDVSGAGLVLEILDDGRALLTWYTYDESGQQMWLYGVGAVQGDSIDVVDVFRTEGDPFAQNIANNPATNLPWGEVKLRFQSCNQMVLSYDGGVIFGTGEISFSRLTHIQNHSCVEQRKFLMGMTPFPFAASSEGYETGFQIAAEHGDIIAHHYDNGIPWPQMRNSKEFSALPQTIQTEWQERLKRTLPDHKIYLALTPIAITRDQLAPYKAEEEDIPLSVIGEPWASARFNDNDVVIAYRNYIETAVEFFRPDFLSIGIEVNLLNVNRPDLWADYVDLQKQTYEYISNLYPSLPVFVSVTANEFYPNITEVNRDQHIAAFREIEPYTDFFALSIYPYMSALLTDSIPDDYFQVLDLISNKPMAITETGYLAESLTLDFGNGNVLQFNGTDALQQQWIEFVLNQAQARDLRFVINFVNKDYDLLCQQINCVDADRLWEDTGLIDENDRERPALASWDAVLNRRYTR